MYIVRYITPRGLSSLFLRPARMKVLFGFEPDERAAKKRGAPSGVQEPLSISPDIGVLALKRTRGALESLSEPEPS